MTITLPMAKMKKYVGKAKTRPASRTPAQVAVGDDEHHGHADDEGQVVAAEEGHVDREQRWGRPTSRASVPAAVCTATVTV